MNELYSVTCADKVAMIPDERAELTPERLQAVYLDDVWRYVSAKLDRREDAEDVTMEVFLAAFSDMRSLRSADSPKLWLLGIARRKVAGKRRWWVTRRETVLDERHPALEQSSEDREAAQELLKLLPDVQQEALILKYVNGLSTEEVARVIRRSLPATNSMLQRARETLRQKGSWLIEGEKRI